MLRRRPAGGSQGNAPAAKPPTYVLHAEPGPFGVISGELDVVGHWLGRVLDLTVAAGADPREVAELHSRILTGLGVLRGGHATGPEMLAVAEDAVVAALALGFHHSGGPAGARAIAETTSNTRKAGTALARASWRPETVQRQTEGETASEAVAHFCHELWRQKPEILRLRAWVKTTIKQIYDDVVIAMRPHIAEGSLWSRDAEGLAGRMENHVRTARKTLNEIQNQIP